MDHSHYLHVKVHVSWESARDTLTTKWNGNGFRSPGKTILVAIESIYIYRKRGSASYIVREVLLVREREREIQTEREIDGSDVTIVALKLAMNLHFPLPKIRTIGLSHITSSTKNWSKSALRNLPNWCCRERFWSSFVNKQFGGRGVLALLSDSFYEISW